MGANVLINHEEDCKSNEIVRNRNLVPMVSLLPTLSSRRQKRETLGTRLSKSLVNGYQALTTANYHNDYFLKGYTLVILTRLVCKIVLKSLLGYFIRLLDLECFDLEKIKGDQSIRYYGPSFKLPPVYSSKVRDTKCFNEGAKYKELENLKTPNTKLENT